MRHFTAAIALACGLLVGAAQAKNLISESHNVSISSAQGICSGGAYYAVVQVTGNNAYYTFDGSTPSSTNGFLLVQNLQISIWDKPIIAGFKIIQAGSGAALQVVCTD